MDDISNQIVQIERSFAALQPDRQLFVLERLAEQFSSESICGSRLASDLFDEVLVRLAYEIETEARVQLAETVACIPEGARRTIGTLANDEAVEVAGPVIRKSPLLTSRDLAEIARRHGTLHRSLVAQRPNIVEAVTDLLIGYGEMPVLEAVARNKTAKLSATGKSRLVDAARNNGGMGSALLARGDLPNELLNRLIDQGRRRPAQGRPGAGGSAAAPARAAPRRPAVSPELVAAKNQIAAVAAERGLNEDDITDFLRRKEWEPVIAVVAELARQPLPIVAQAMNAPQLDRMLVALRCAGINWSVVESVLRFRMAVLGQSRSLNDLKTTYGRISRNAAERALRVAGGGTRSAA